MAKMVVMSLGMEWKLNLMFVRLIKVSTKKREENFCNNTLHALMQFSSLFLVDTSINQRNITFISKIYALTHIKCMYANLLKKIINSTGIKFRFLYLWSWQEFRLQINQGLDANRPQFITVFFSKYKVHVLPQFKSIPSAVDPCIYWDFFRKTSISLYWWTSSVTNWKFNQSRWGTLSSAWRIPSQLWAEEKDKLFWFQYQTIS